MILAYLAPAHTNGDLFVYLPQQKVVLAGDILTPGFATYPIVHVGGNSRGWIENTEALLLLESDTYVVGHGQVQTKNMVQATLQDAIKDRDGIKALVDRNATYPEVKIAFPEAPVGFNGLFFPTYTQTTYNKLIQGYPTAIPPWFNFGIVQYG